VVKQYDGKVRVVYKNMVVHPQIVMLGHQAGCAASKQGKFVEFRHAWWDKAYAPYTAAHDPSKLGESTIMDIAKDLKLDTAKFKTDMDSAECKAHVQQDMAELNKWHVNSTPSFFMDGKPFRWNGSPDASGFKPQIDAELQKVQSSGVPCGEYYDKEVMGKGEKQFRSAKDPKPS
jgi:protein-disulfide isomerase